MNAIRQTWDALDQDVPIPSCAQTSHIADRGFSRSVHDLNVIGRYLQQAGAPLSLKYL